MQKDSVHRKFIFGLWGHLRGIWVSLYMKVIGSRLRLQEQKVQNSLFLQCKTLMGNNSSSVEDRAVKFACSMGFSTMVDCMA